MAKNTKIARTTYPHLGILADISTLITHSHDLQETLDQLVATVAERMQTEVCSLYIFDPKKNRLILVATMGLDPESVGKVSMATGEGLDRFGHRADEAGDGGRCPRTSSVTNIFRKPTKNISTRSSACRYWRRKRH